MTLIDRLINKMVFEAAEVTGGGSEAPAPAAAAPSPAPEGQVDAGAAPAPEAAAGGETQPKPEAKTAPKALIDDDDVEAPADEKPAEAEGEGETKAEEEKPDAPAFDPAQIKLPEGMSVDQAAMDRFAPIMNELGLDAAKAQPIVDAYIEIRKADELAFVDLQNQWSEATKADPEIGKGNLKTTLDLNKRALASYGTPEFKDLLIATGIVNHPATVRFLRQVGATTTGDIPATSEVAAAPKRDAVDILYPKTKG